ncbi:hypothetical protein [Pseudomonas mucidolens]|uniref:hypothetical protein n=1 Tax=Pseudomonas mucidolens TaxID=46679 RepID=UPI0030DC625C
MPNYALISEGITDQVILEKIIYTIIEAASGEEPDINILQPYRDATDNARQAKESFGGWEQVLEFCENPTKLSEALAFNDFLVIHIDTDCCEHQNFGVSLHRDETEIPVDELIKNVEDLINKKLTANFTAVYSERVIFAIAVHATECWLIPAHEPLLKKKNRTKSCEDHLKRALAKSGNHFEKNHDTYFKLSSCFNKLKNINTHKQHNRSLEIFIDNLESSILKPA